MGSTSRQRSNGYATLAPTGTVRTAVKIAEHLAVLEVLNLPVILITPQYMYRWVNSCYAAAQGKHPEEIIGRTARGSG